MNEFIHFMVRNPGYPGGLLYPSEIETNYNGIGSFFILGELNDNLRDEYIFFAIRNQEAIPVGIRRDNNRRSTFSAAVFGIGDFIFVTRKIRPPSIYRGMMRNVYGMYAGWRIEPLNPEALDLAAREKKFYFIGYSPRVDG